MAHLPQVSAEFTNLSGMPNVLPDCNITMLTGRLIALDAKRRVGLLQMLRANGKHIHVTLVLTDVTQDIPLYRRVSIRGSLVTLHKQDGTEHTAVRVHTLLARKEERHA
jgi:hypothetical protein